MCQMWPGQLPSVGKIYAHVGSSDLALHITHLWA